MSLLVRAAVLGGLAYLVSRAVRRSQDSLESSRHDAPRLTRTADDDLLEPEMIEDKPSTRTI